MKTSNWATQFRGMDRKILDSVSVPSIIVLMAVAAIVAIVRKRWALAVRALVTVAGALVSVQVLKAWVLSRPNFHIGNSLANSMPSGHTAAGMAAAVALVMVVPHQWRSAAAWVGAIFAASMGIATVVNQWHRPGDVLAAIAVVGAWALLLSPTEVGRDTSGAGQRGAWVLGWAASGAGVALTGVSTLIVFVAPAFRNAHSGQEAVTYFTTKVTLVPGGLAVGFCALIVGLSFLVVHELDCLARR